VTGRWPSKPPATDAAEHPRLPLSERPGQCIGVQSSPDPLRPGDVETATAKNDSSPPATQGQFVDQPKTFCSCRRLLLEPLVAAAGVEGDARPGLALPVRTTSVLSPGRPSAWSGKEAVAAVEAFTVPWTWISSRPPVLFPTSSGYGYAWACPGWGNDQRRGFRDCPQELEFRVGRGVILECLQSGDAVGGASAATRTRFCVHGCEAELLCAPRRRAG